MAVYVQGQNSLTRVAGLSADVNNFAGATPISHGEVGVVPAPEAGEQDKFLKGDGQWSDLPVASEEVAGVIKVGKNLTIDEDGKLNAQAGGEGGISSISAKEGNIIVAEEDGIYATASMKDEIIVGDTEPEDDDVKLWIDTNDQLLKSHEKGVPGFEPVCVMDIQSMVGGGYEYSEEEKVIGKWVDGRPVYRKVIKTITPANNNYQAIPITDLNVDIAISTVASVFWSVNGDEGWINTNYYTFNGSRILCFTQGNTIQFYQNGFVSGKDAYIILEYTKTTDEPNSFTLDMLATGDIDTVATDDEVNEIFS